MWIFQLSVLAGVQSHPLRAGRVQLRSALQRTAAEPQAEARAQRQRNRVPKVQAGPAGRDEHGRKWRRCRRRRRRSGRRRRWRRQPAGTGQRRRMGAVGREARVPRCGGRGRFANERVVDIAQQLAAVPPPASQLAGLAVRARRAGRRRGQLQQQLKRRRRRSHVAAVLHAAGPVQDERWPRVLHRQLVHRRRGRRVARRRGDVAQIPDPVQTEHVHRRFWLRHVRHRPFPLQRAQLRITRQVRYFNTASVLLTIRKRKEYLL